MKTQREGCNVGLTPYTDISHNYNSRTVELATLHLQGNTSVLISVTRATERKHKELSTWKFPKTLPGIEPGTSRIVAQSLNQLYHPSPPSMEISIVYSSY